MQVNVSMGGYTETIHHLRVIPDKMLSDTGLRAMTRAAAAGYAGYIKEEHVSGQRLKVRSGTLKDNIVSKSISGSTDSMVTAGSVPYSRIHDTGYNNPRQSVRAHRRVNSRGNGFVDVPAYTRHAHQKERRYFRDAVIGGGGRAQRNIDIVLADFVRRANGGG
jgi:hypothetical protein